MGIRSQGFIGKGRFQLGQGRGGSTGRISGSGGLIDISILYSSQGRNSGSQRTVSNGHIPVGSTGIVPQGHAFCITCLGRVPKGQGIGAAGFCPVTDGYSIVGRIGFIAQGRSVHDVGRVLLIVGLVPNGDIVAVLDFIIACIIDAVTGLGADGDVIAAFHIAACTLADGHILHARHIVAGTGANGNERPCILGFPFPFAGSHAGIVAQGNGFVRIGRGIVADGQGIVIISRSRLADGGGATGGSRTRSNGIAAFVCSDRPFADDHRIGPFRTGVLTDGNGVSGNGFGTGTHGDGIGSAFCICAFTKSHGIFGSSHFSTTANSQGIGTLSHRRTLADGSGGIGRSGLGPCAHRDIIGFDHSLITSIAVIFYRGSLAQGKGGIARAGCIGADGHTVFPAGRFDIIGQIFDRNRFIRGTGDSAIANGDAASSCFIDGSSRTKSHGIGRRIHSGPRTQCRGVTAPFHFGTIADGRTATDSRRRTGSIEHLGAIA